MLQDVQDIQLIKKTTQKRKDRCDEDGTKTNCRDRTWYRRSQRVLKETKVNIERGM